MRRLGLSLLMLVAGSAVVAMNLDRLFLFHFDPARISPAAAGEPRLREVEWQGLILWIARPTPGKPVILYFPGNAGNLAMRAPRFTQFLDQGYGLIAMGYPGSSGSTGAQSAENIDRLAAALYRDAAPFVGPTPRVLYGESLGTGVAVALAATQTEANQPAALILEAPFTSIRDMAATLYPQIADQVDKLPERWPSKDLIPAVHVPLLVLHGAEDDLIPPAMGRALHDLSPAETKRLHIVHGAGHTDVWQPGALAVLFDFLKDL